MSSKVNQPLPFPFVVKPEDAPPPQRSGRPRENDRTRERKLPSISVSGHKPAPINLPKPTPVPFAALEMDQEDLSALRSVVADQTTYEITQLYSTIEGIAGNSGSLEVKQGLKALEEQVRLREYLHIKRTATT